MALYTAQEQANLDALRAEALRSASEYSSYNVIAQSDLALLAGHTNINELGNWRWRLSDGSEFGLSQRQNGIDYVNNKLAAKKDAANRAQAALDAETERLQVKYQQAFNAENPQLVPLIQQVQGQNAVDAINAAAKGEVTAAQAEQAAKTKKIVIIVSVSVAVVVVLGVVYFKYIRKKS